MNELTERQQYDELLKIKDRLLFFNEFGEVTLEQGNFEILKKLYKVYFSKFTLFNTTCSSCVKEVLNLCISRYGALKKQFDKVKEVVEPEQSEEEKVVERPKQAKTKKK